MGRNILLIEFVCNFNQLYFFYYAYLCQSSVYRDRIEVNPKAKPRAIKLDELTLS